MNTNQMLLTVAVAAAAFATNARADVETTHTATYDAPVALELSFVFHIDQDLAEQDIFIEKPHGSGAVYRPTKSERDMSAQLHAAAAPVAHAPFDANGNGPFEKGRALGVTLGEWFAAKGDGRYTCEDNQAHIELDFSNLVPNGVYTMWHYFMAWPPTDPFNGTYDLPIGARDGHQAVFSADEDGAARFERTFTPCLQLTGEHLAAGLAIAWHSDGRTYGPSPGEFTTNTHVQLFVDLPKRNGL